MSNHTSTDANRSIKCSVGDCEYHCNTENYCSLDCVTIGTHESNPTLCQCVDCESFKLRNERSPENYR